MRSVRIDALASQHTEPVALWGGELVVRKMLVKTQRRYSVEES